MDCPECGFDAGEAKFCPECGSRTEGAGGATDGEVCPECGAEAGDAKYCPECGYRLVDAPPAPPARELQAGAARSRSAQGAPGGESQSGRSRQQRRQAERHAAHRHAQRSSGPAQPAGRTDTRTTTWLIWGGFAAAAVVIVVLIVALVGGSGGGNGGATAPPAAVTPVASVAADTSGSYQELVARANDLYDQGITAFDNNDSASGQKYFAAAATVYAAAWKKQPTDPSVGTDFATALFYSGQTDEALTQVDEVLKTSPDFQTAHLNRGIFLKTAAQDAKDAGETATSDELLADAKASFEKAVSIDPASEPGQSAAQQLEQL